MATLQGLAKTDLHLLSVFMCVVEQGGFSAAQIALNVSQSTVSRQMTELETRLGIRLCQRGRIGFRLTDQGKSVHMAAEKLFRALDGFQGEIAGTKGEIAGELSLALIDNWISDEKAPVIDALAALKRWGPSIQLYIYSLPPNEIELSVFDGRTDIGIGVFHHHRPGLDYQDLSSDPIDLYCGAEHPQFPQAGTLQAVDAVKEADYVKRSYLSEDRVAPLVSDLKSTATANQMEGVAFLILTGNFVGYLPVSYASRWLVAGRMKSVHAKTFEVTTQIEIVTRKGATLSRVAAQFLKSLADA